MTNSMTAFARAERDADSIQLIWEIRSVNHRYLDINLKLPDEFRVLDTPCRERINDVLSRGRIDANLKIENSTPISSQSSIDDESVTSVVKLLEKIEESHPGLQPARSIDVLRWPGVLVENSTESEKIHENISSTLEQALNQLAADRSREGKRLGEIIIERIIQCRKISTSLTSDIDEIQQKTIERWKKRLEEISSDVDPERIAQETAILLTKGDVSEELDRFKTHLDEVETQLSADKPVGRNLDFLMQELNREANTLGAKSVDQQMTNASIELKVLVDQMREQVQNIE